MSIQYAILGLLSWHPFSGYDLKKMFSESSTFYWSGNNNQIYKTLLQLQEDGLASNEVLHQEDAPTKKIYSITEKGRKVLREWVKKRPDIPELKNTFLIQLAWADPLTSEELMCLLNSYQEEIAARLMVQREILKRDLNNPKRNPREVYLWQMIGANAVSSLENELNWITRVRNGLNAVT